MTVNNLEVSPVVISFVRALDGNNGDVSYTGVGFKPTVIIFVTSGVSGSGPSIGVCTNADKNGRGLSIDGTSLHGTGMAAVITCLFGADGQTAVLKTLDNDGFTLTWTKGGGPGAGSEITCRAICYR